MWSPPLSGSTGSRMNTQPKISSLGWESLLNRVHRTRALTAAGHSHRNDTWLFVAVSWSAAAFVEKGELCFREPPVSLALPNASGVLVLQAALQ